MKQVRRAICKRIQWVVKLHSTTIGVWWPDEELCYLGDGC